ncbi:class I SAM-dependent methyltransferase [Pararhodobacter zhoushanensis]|uniref:class I SAM-dependent methyltransferase n=1 Tax=Pararhodobacter zhoushanensis TaxID=2479545 RepID=UPI000F8CED0E|nr:class I SAM-dependent methyltransferase [Pararhodobacter zhoushanensis]
MTGIEEELERAKDIWAASEFYTNAENSTEYFWDPETPFGRLLEDIDLKGYVLEFACGHGRHTEILVRHAKKVIFSDLIHRNVDLTLSRLAGSKNAVGYHSDGKSLSFCKSSSIDTVFSFGDMIFMSPDLIELYLRDIYRVLKVGGRAILHHSNVDADLASFSALGGRFRMTCEKFASMSEDVGFSVVRQATVDHSLAPALDGLTIVEKPGLKLKMRRSKRR